MNIDQLTQAQLGYIAGIVDGEGTIGLYRNRTYRNTLKPEVHICNTDLGLLETIQEWVGGHIHPRSIRMAGRKQVYSLAFQKQSDILGLLKAIVPYLIIKKPQASLLIAWCTLHQGGEFFMDEEIIVMMSKNNKRGITEEVSDAATSGKPDSRQP